MSRRVVVCILAAIVFLGFAARVAAVRWNWFMHGDVMADAIVTAVFHRDGKLAMFPDTLVADPSTYVMPDIRESKPLVQHAPVTPILGSAVTHLRAGEPTVEEAFLSLRIVSLLAGMLVILLAYLAGTRLLNTSAGLVVAGLTAFSFVLIDYSGNGAMYSLHAAIYLLWILVAFRASSPARSAILGALAGICYLVNFQAIILVPAGIVVLFVQEQSWRNFFINACLFAGASLLAASPWLIRNALVFGDPLYHHAWNMGYVYTKAGFTAPEGSGPFQVGLPEKLMVLFAALRISLPNNLYYAARKLFILAPFAFFFFSFGLIDIAFSRERLRKSFPILAVLVFHILISATWPIWKFRFFVPLLPLVFLLAVEELWHLPLSSAWRRISAGVMIAAMIVVSVLTYRAIPTHTTYYDGALTTDPFSGWEELDYVRKHGILSFPHAP